MSDSNGNSYTQGRQGGLINLGTKSEQRENLKNFAGFFDPTQTFRECYSSTCGFGGWMMAGLSVTPVGKILGKAGKVGKAADDVWALPPTRRGQVIESRLASSEYKDWFNIGSTHNGYFPLVDFQHGKTLVSL